MVKTNPPQSPPEQQRSEPDGVPSAPGLVSEPHALVLFQEMLQELRASRQREDFMTFGFSSVLVLLIAHPVLYAGTGPSLWARLAAAAGIGLLGWRVNGFLSENRNRQNQIRKVVTITEHAYPFPTDRARVRLSDFKNLDGPGEWDKSDYSLADWDRSEYSMFLKLLLVVAMFAVMVF